MLLDKHTLLLQSAKGFDGLFHKNSGMHVLYTSPLKKNRISLTIERANYQAAVWKAALTAAPEITGPEGEGWKLIDGRLVVDWTKAAPAPNAILGLVAYKCRTNCETR